MLCFSYETATGLAMRHVDDSYQPAPGEAVFAEWPAVTKDMLLAALPAYAAAQPQ